MRSIAISAPAVAAAAAAGLINWDQVSSAEPLVVVGDPADHEARAYARDAVVAPDPRPGIDGAEPRARQPADTLGVADVVMSILGARKAMPWASAAAIWRQRRGAVVYVLVTLLERPPSGQPGGRPTDTDGRARVIAEFAARRLGGDLDTAFGASDVIILR